MNPFNERMSDHNTWPVILSMYNILTYLCQKRKYLFLTVLISGPQQPGIDIDVFLEPMMQEFEKQMEGWGLDVRCIPTGGLHIKSNNFCDYQ
jgi:hypothetical protein